ncbi:tyrosine-type recombinase/integrase [Ferdinandcohnia sp. SAFN-114]|uniref:tyrosine-type recombinase/integrase n=1 Tax=Ferdinandcohnia sp. SAFN-114 TaxID=3387275 RepID=UPI003F7F43C9
MERIEEIKGITGLSYKRIIDNDKEYLVSVEGFKREINNYLYFLLVNPGGGIINDVYTFLNNTENKKCIGNADYKKREQAYTALKLLYSFMELFYITDLKEIDDTEINRLEAFLKGGEKIGHSITFISKTNRSHSTIDKYYSAYRKYFDYLNIEPNVFSETIKIRKSKGFGDGFLAHTKTTTEEKYKVSHKILTKKETPKYISYKEYLIIRETLEDMYTVREEIIVILMYKYGLRIGEVLGLTTEDIDFKGNTITLRNRLTDKPYQKAKGCISVLNRMTYNSQEYNTKNHGYQIVEVDKEDMKILNEYYKDSRSPLKYLRKDKRKSKVLSNLEFKNIADKVTERKDIQHNSYVFISKNGTPITNTGWNNIIKDIFITAGIVLDKKKKEDNLNHRLRHGFAMYKVVVEKYDQLKLKNALRHGDINSCKVYFRVDEKERERLAKETQELIKSDTMSRK